MSAVMTDETPQNTPTQFIPLYKHVKRPQWGTGILAWERPDRRGYQFEDGKLRIIKKGYYGLLQTVRAPMRNTRQKLAMMCHRAGLMPMRRDSFQPTFADQAALFSTLHPGGFTGKKWLSKKRGQGVKRRLKRHRNAAIAHANELITRERLDELIDNNKCGDLFPLMTEILKASDLVTKRQLQPLYRLSILDYHEVAVALRDLLYGDGDLADRFDAYCKSLKSPRTRLSWQLCTALPALVLPREHVCIRPKAFVAQAKILGLRKQAERRPNGHSYARMLELARSVDRELARAGMPASDLLDVHDFMWTTLRPSAYRQLGKLPMPATPEGDASADEASKDATDSVAAAA